MTKRTFKIAASALGGLAALALVGAAGDASAHKPKGEKCYGVAKAGKNLCATKTTSCAGTSSRDGQKDAWIIVPRGVCETLVGGSKRSS